MAQKRSAGKANRSADSCRKEVMPNLSTQSIVWCIENSMAYVHGEQAALEWAALVEYIEKLEASQQSAHPTPCPECGKVFSHYTGCSRGVEISAIRRG